MQTTYRRRLLIPGVLALVACSSQVQEPWVPDAGYLQQERTRNAQLERQLDHRLHWQQDR
jgi:hypothetical protein